MRGRRNAMQCKPILFTVPSTNPHMVIIWYLQRPLLVYLVDNCENEATVLWGVLCQPGWIPTTAIGSLSSFIIVYWFPGR